MTNPVLALDPRTNPARLLRSLIRGPVNQQNVVQLLLWQEFRCALTGRPLTPETVALDAIVPLDRGGSPGIENAQLICMAVKRAKGELTNDEFIALCREVAAHMPSSDDERRPAA